MSTIAENNLMIFHIDSLDRAITQLSLRGYRILKITAKNLDEAPLIEIDRALEEFEVKELTEKQIGYSDQWECRVYWRLA